MDNLFITWSAQTNIEETNLCWVFGESELLLVFYCQCFRASVHLIWICLLGWVISGRICSWRRCVKYEEKKLGGCCIKKTFYLSQVYSGKNFNYVDLEPTPTFILPEARLDRVTNRWGCSVPERELTVFNIQAWGKQAILTPKHCAPRLCNGARRDIQRQDV